MHHAKSHDRQRRFVAIARRNGFTFANGKINRLNDGAAADKVALGLVRSGGGNGAGFKRRADATGPESDSPPKVSKTRKLTSITEEASNGPLVSNAVGHDEETFNASQTDPEANTGEESDRPESTRPDGR